MKERFKLPLTCEQACDLITAAYQNEVEYRHRYFVDDEFTRSNIMRVAQYFSGESTKFGLMFLGLSGNGKTTLLYALQQAINLLARQSIIEDTGIRIVDAKEIITMAKEPREYINLKNCPMLAVEDMGREPTEVMDFGNILNPIIDLLEYRYNAQLFTAITTNLNPKEIRQKYGARVADRFNEMLECIIFKNKSYRN